MGLRDKNIYKYLLSLLNMIKRGNKRGQELSTNAIVLIILAVVVLVILIFGFTLGWNRIAPWISSGNVDTIVNQCGVACNTKSAYGFCGEEVELKASDLPGGDRVKKGTCYFFSKNKDYVKYGILSCPSIDCSPLLQECAKFSPTKHNDKEYTFALSASRCGENQIDVSNQVKDISSENGYCCGTLETENNQQESP